MLNFLTLQHWHFDLSCHKIWGTKGPDKSTLSVYSQICCVGFRLLQGPGKSTLSVYSQICCVGFRLMQLLQGWPGSTFRSHSFSSRQGANFGRLVRRERLTLLGSSFFKPDDIIIIISQLIRSSSPSPSRQSHTNARPFAPCESTRWSLMQWSGSCRFLTWSGGWCGTIMGDLEVLLR